MRKNNTDYVRIASFIFTNRYEQEYGTGASGVLYNKYMTLLNRKLLSDGMDMKLPHCWYRWGDEVVRFGMPYLIWNHDDPRFTTVSYRGGVPKEYNRNDPIIAMAEEFSGEFIQKYGGPEGSEMAIDEVYSNAPFQFQNEYRKLRESLKISRSNVGFDNFSEYILTIFDVAMASFPDEFKSLKGQKDEFKAVFRMAVNGNASRDDLFELTECFWFFFCYHLRLNKKCNANVQRSTLDIWKSMIPLEESRYRHNIQTYAFLFYHDGYSDPVVDRLLSEREVAIEDADRILSELNGGI